MTDDELRQLIASNARAIEALGETVRENSRASQRSIENLERVVASFADQVSTFISQTAAAMQQAQAEREEFRRAMMGIANLVSSLDSDRPTILRKLNSIEGKVDRILEQGEDAD